MAGGAASPRYRGAGATQAITQPWLKASAKTWAAEAPSTMTAGPVRAVIGAVGLLSEHLVRRSDGGIDPADLSHRDVQDFLARPRAPGAGRQSVGAPAGSQHQHGG